MSQNMMWVVSFYNPVFPEEGFRPHSVCKSVNDAYAAITNYHQEINRTQEVPRMNTKVANSRHPVFTDSNGYAYRIHCVFLEN